MKELTEEQKENMKKLNTEPNRKDKFKKPSLGNYLAFERAVAKKMKDVKKKELEEQQKNQKK
ncbi:MAG: hypothetical protein JEZ03_17185 [Bacteroidales bacterium]|nr:hypothetical protein [Bacteroidales bacterium]